MSVRSSEVVARGLVQHVQTVREVLQVSRSTAGWVAIIGAFAAWELLHLADGVPGGTFSELVWGFLALSPWVWWGSLVAAGAATVWAFRHLFWRK